MGSSLDRYLQRVPDSPSGNQPSQVDDYLAGRPPKTDVGRLELSTGHADVAKADRAARVLRLRGRTKLPQDLIERNLDEIEQRAQAANYDPEELRATSPAVAAWFAEHPDNASIGGDDVDKLSTIEKLFVSLAGPRFVSPAITAVYGRRSGARQSELGRLGSYVAERGGLPNVDEGTRQRIDQLQRQLANEPDGRDFIDRVLFHGSQIFGQLASTAPRALGSGIIGGVAGGIAGSTVGPAGTLIGMKGGFQVGLAAGFAGDTYQIESGSAYLELSRMLDDQGQPIEEGTRQAIAAGVGAVNALLETGGVAMVAAPYRTVVRKFMRESVKDAFVRPTMRMALNDFGRSYIGALAGETGTEIAQELSNVIGEEIARSGSAGELSELLEDPAKREAMMQRLAGIAQQTAEGMLLVGLPGAGIHGASTAYQARKASQREQFFLQLGEAVQGSKTFERLPDAMQAVVERATKDGPIETLYAPVETWDTYWQSAKLDPAAVAREMGVEKEWEEAHATGGDIAIPTPTYATRLAPTEHNAFFAKELRARPNEMNAREAEEFLDKMKQLEEETAPSTEGEKTEDPSQQVGARITEQLVAAGYDEATAGTYAKVYETAFRTLGARTGIDALELFERYNLSISAPEQAPAAPIGERVKLEDVVDRAMAARERAGEAAGREADEAGESVSVYEIPADARDANARNEQKEYVYARTPKGALRGNLSAVSVNGLIDELARLMEAQQADRQLEDSYNAWRESGVAEAIAQLPEKERLGKSRRTTDEHGNRVKRQQEDLPSGDDLMDPEKLAEMRQLEKDYRRAAQSIQQRKRSVAKLEAELQRRGAEGVEQKVFKAIAGDAAIDFDPSTFQQPPRSALIDRFVRLRTTEADPNVSPSVREEAARRAADIEAQARAEYEAAIAKANAEYEAKHGAGAAMVFNQSAREAGITQTPEFQRWFGDSKVVDENGEPLVVYHGANRSDRFGPVLLKERATSGPMPFFTDDPAIASKYAEGKNDTSIAPEDENYEAWFRLKIPGKAEAVNLDRAWHLLTYEQRKTIKELAPRITTDDEGEQIILGPPSNKTGNGGYHLEDSYSRGNPLKALINAWLLSGSLFNDEVRFHDVLRLAGVPLEMVEFHDPNAALPGVTPVYLSIQNPLIANAIAPDVIAALEEASERAPEPDEVQGRGDTWSKDKRNPTEWIEQLKEDQAKGANSHVWTSIPDWVTATLVKLGFDGIRDLGGKMGGVGHEVWIPFEPGQVKSATGNRGTYDRESSNILYQGSFDDFVAQQLEQSLPGGDRPRGQIKFKVGDQAAVSIELLADADLSTFLHETGHFYLEVMRDLATQGDANEDIRTDFDIIRTWLGVEGDGPFTREQHEKFARGFELYLMKGQAPSAELRSAFARFRAWLVGLYRSFDNLRVLLSDDVRGVFDRLLAGEDEIAAAQREQKMDPLFADPASVGMTEKDAARYRDAVLEARSTAENELAARLMADVQREQDAVYKAERVRVREEVVEEVNQERDSIAIALMSRGTMPDGSPLPAELEAFKLSKTALLAEYESRYPNLMGRLRRFFLYSKEGGVHPDQAAEILGYLSGDELLQALLAVEESPRARIERITDERMKADDPNLVTPAELPVEAMKAVHNEKRAQVLQMELAHLASGNLPALKGLVRRVSRRLPPLEEVRRQTENIVNHKRLRDLNPIVYQRAEEKAARLAVDALLRGDVEAAFDEKQRELLNHELYRAASKAKEEIERVASDLGRFSKSATRESLGKAGGDYLEQIDGLLARFDFRKAVSLTSLDRRRSLREWYQEQVDAGLAPVIPEKLLDEAYRTHYKELTPAELRDLYHAVLSIEHLAKLKNRLISSARARELDEARTEIINSIGTHHDLREKPEGHAPETLTKNLAKGAKRGLAEHTRMEFLFDFLDGFQGLGVVWQYLFKPFADAETAENEYRAKDAAAMRDIFSAYSEKERADWFTKKVYIPTARSSKHDGTFTKASIIAAALNWGNDYNRDALLRGYDWTIGQAEAILGQLDGRDWLTVQRLWDHIETYWPAIEQLEKDLSGVAPLKVEATPFAMQGVNMRGGYYPILFDRERSTRQTSLEEKSSVQEMFGGNWARAMTRHGHTIERTNTGGKPLHLELSGLSNHLGQVAHDLTHRKAVVDVYRLISDPDIAKAIELAVGREMFLQLKPWLHAIAGDRARTYSGWMEKLLGRARQGATVVGLGLKVTSAALQTLGYTIAVNELGPKYAAAGLREAYGDPRKIKSTWRFITERSAMMRDRLENYDRDVRDYARRQDTIEAAQATWFIFIGYMDLGTSMPAWLGAYRKAMDGAVQSIEKGDENLAIDYADKVVRETQAAGAAKDLASVQRGGEAWRLFTMFYSSMSIIFNQFARAGQRYSVDRNTPQLVAAAALLWFVPVVLEAAIRGDAPDDDEGWAKHFAKKVAAYPFGSVVLFRDLVGALDRYDYSGSPAGDVGATVVKAMKAAGKVFTDDELTRTDWKSIVNTVGYAAKLPTAQLWKTTEYLHDWLTGIELPENLVAGIYRAAITGKPR